MDGWMGYGLMDVQMDGWIIAWMGYGLMDGCMDEWMYGCAHDR